MSTLSTFGGSAEQAGWHKKPATLHPPINQALIIDGQRFPFGKELTKMSKETKHTPGPYHLGARYGHLQTEVLGPTGRAIATVWTHAFEHPRIGVPATYPHPEGQANARLIAAAPELLEVIDTEYGELSKEVITMGNGIEYVRIPYVAFAQWDMKRRAAIAAAREEA